MRLDERFPENEVLQSYFVSISTFSAFCIVFKRFCRRGIFVAGLK